MGSFYFCALPSQFSESPIFLNLLRLLVLAEVLVSFSPMIFSHATIAGVITAIFLSDSSAAVSASGSSSELNLSACLPASDPYELGSSSEPSSEGLLVFPAFLLPSVPF